MANPKGNPQNLKPFKKGNNANPLGAGAHDPVARAIKKLASKDLIDIIEASSTGTINELSAIAKDPKSSVIKVAVAMCMAKAIDKGDWSTVEKIVERCVGKTIQRVDITTGGERIKNPTLPQVQIVLPSKDE